MGRAGRQSKGKAKIQLAFALRTCACGGQRLAGLGCPDCGRAPSRNETDFGWQRRSRITRSVLKVMEHGAHAAVAPKSGVADVDDTTMFDTLSELMPRFIRELEGVA